MYICIFLMLQLMVLGIDGFGERDYFAFDKVIVNDEK